MGLCEPFLATNDPLLIDIVRDRQDFSHSNTSFIEYIMSSDKSQDRIKHQGPLLVARITNSHQEDTEYDDIKINHHGPML